jgi:hypothetical protein
MYFDTVEQLVTIPKDKRKLGMFAYVNTEGKHYKLVDNKDVLDAACWKPYELVSKEYVDNAISSAALSGGGAAVDLSEYAKKTDIPDISNLATKDEIPTVPDVSSFETTDHAEETYAKKADLEALEGVVPKVINDVFSIPAGSSNDPLVLELEIPNGTVGINVIAIAEVNGEPDIETSFDVPENATYPLTFSFAVPAGTTSVDIEAEAETEEITNVNETPVVGQNYATNPISDTNAVSNAFGVAVQGSTTPIESDFVTYG